MARIVSSGFEYRSDRKSTEFRAWLDSVNASWGELAAGAFKASGTGVATRVLAIER